MMERANTVCGRADTVFTNVVESDVRLQQLINKNQQ